MHTRRMATFLLGIWLGCSVFMGLIAIENLRLPGIAEAAPSDFSAEQTRILLRHQAAEQNRLYFYTWEEIELVLGIVLAICLFLGTQKRILPLVLCGLLLLLVMFEHFGLTPELTYRGREADFPPGSALLDTQMRVLMLTQVYAGIEGAKLLVGAVLTSYLFVFRTRQRVRKVDETVSTRRGSSELHQ
jgi:hypothetical protein